jgi:shikimate kinase
MRFSLIGMSNIGKTSWAKRISSAKKCAHINCDALIERKLKSELADGNYHGIDGVAKWMGFPFDSDYKKRSGLYIIYEREVMRESLDNLKKDKNFAAVIDTTGSVIYTGDDILDELRTTTRVIYFEASEQHIDELFRKYIANPKPVIWDNCYKAQKNETTQDTLKRCYPLLLRERISRYKEIAHITIPFEIHHNKKTNIEDLVGKP